MSTKLGAHQGAPTRIRNIDFLLRRALGRLPVKKGAGGRLQPFDPRNGTFLSFNANKNRKTANGIADCVKAFTTNAAPGSPPEVGDNLIEAVCGFLGALFGAGAS